MKPARPIDLGSVTIGERQPDPLADPLHTIDPTGEGQIWTGRMPQGALEGAGIHLLRGNVRILQGIDVRARPGRPLALTGPSGSGKSTLLAVLGGLTRPDRGAVSFEGNPVSPGHPALRRDIGIVLQGYGLVGLLTAQENVEITLRALNLPPDRIAASACAALAQVGLSDRAEHLVEDLSGGQQQRVALARAFAAQPPALLADEPTAELDHETRDEVLRLLIDYATEGSGRVLVIATHDPDVAALCQDHLRLTDGRVEKPAP
jgi:ABC-type lipoprotein export system ATPase subunit